MLFAYKYVPHSIETFQVTARNRRFPARRSQVPPTPHAEAMTKSELYRQALDKAGIPSLVADLKRKFTSRGFGINDDRGPVHGADELGFTITLPGVRFAISLRANHSAKLLVTEANATWQKRLGIEPGDWTQTPVPYWPIPRGTRRPVEDIVTLLESFRPGAAESSGTPALTVSALIRFAQVNHGGTFKTLDRKRPYRIFLEDGKVVFRPASGTPFYPDLERYVSIYNERPSLKASDYPKDLWCNSYFVSTVDVLLRNVSEAHPKEDLAEDLLSISAPTETERKELIKCRLGQGKFRGGLLKLRGRCYVTGITDPRLLRASHIKPWRAAKNAERLDPHNGLLLTPLFDHLFDQGLISFADDGDLLIASSLPPQTLAALKILPKFKGSDLGAKTRAYLAHHRAEFQRRQGQEA